MNISKLIILPLLLLAACATPITTSPQGDKEAIDKERHLQKSMIFESWMENYDRLYNVYYPITAVNRQFCADKTAYSLGMTTWNIDSIDWGFKTVARERYGLHEGLAIANVADKSPAARAGLRSGDLIVDFNGKIPPIEKKALKLFDDEVRNSEGKAIKFQIERKGKMMTISAKPEKVCDYPLNYNHENPEVNAYADGSKIMVFKGMVNFVKSDNEIALVLAHELAHNAMGHLDKKRTNQMLGSLGGLAIDAIFAGAGVNTGNNFGSFGADIGGNVFSVEFEQEADYVGMYFMERAGYSSKNVANYWRRLGMEAPQTLYKRDTHPISPERYIAIQKTYDEIASKKSRGKTLVPEFKTAEQ